MYQHVLIYNQSINQFILFFIRKLKATKKIYNQLVFKFVNIFFSVKHLIDFSQIKLDVVR